MSIETRTSGSSGPCSTNSARQKSVGQEISEVSFVCFMHHFTCSFLESIEHDFIKAIKIQAGNLPCPNICQIIWQKRLSWITEMEPIFNDIHVVANWEFHIKARTTCQHSSTSKIFKSILYSSIEMFLVDFCLILFNITEREKKTRWFD